MGDIFAETVKKKKDHILRTGESFDEWDVYCPYCAYEQQDVWDLGIPVNGDEEEEVQCQKCERHFAAKARVVFSTRKLK